MPGRDLREVRQRFLAQTARKAPAFQFISEHAASLPEEVTAAMTSEVMVCSTRRPHPPEA
ncbi:hypothetical protein GCM10007148_18850 [Parvularcula lutaonensis]|nr:hypothetical protein GCM10007148_18850 [Parvularcula lutaonensis]